MKRKHILITLAIAAVVIVCFQTNIFDSLLVFLLVGGVPGTSFSLPPLVMLALLGGSVLAFTHWVAIRQLYPGSPKVQASRNKVLRKTARTTVRKYSAKSTTHSRRFSRLEA